LSDRPEFLNTTAMLAFSRSSIRAILAATARTSRSSEGMPPLHSSTRVPTAASRRCRWLASCREASSFAPSRRPFGASLLLLSAAGSDFRLILRAPDIKAAIGKETPQSRSKDYSSAIRRITGRFAFRKSHSCRSVIRQFSRHSIAMALGWNSAENRLAAYGQRIGECGQSLGAMWLPPPG